NEHGRFIDVTRTAHAGLPTRGQGCVAADLDGDGHTDLFVTTATDDELLWNNGDATFTEGARKAGIVSYGWHAGAAVTDVNGDDPNRLYLNEPGGRYGFHFVQVAPAFGVADRNAGMGVAAADYSGDGRPDLFVTNSRGQGNAAFRSDGETFANAWPAFKP